MLAGGQKNHDPKIPACLVASARRTLRTGHCEAAHSSSNKRDGHMEQTLQTSLLIGGEFVPGAGDVEDVLNPATGDVIARIAEASLDQVQAAVAAASRAFPAWAKTVPKDRANLLLKLADAIEARATEFARLESLNCGKPYLGALNDEIPAVADVFRFFAGAVRCQTGQLSGEYLPGYTSMVRRDPLGVVASIAPWNYPLMMAAWKIAPAVAAGNTVVLKPSEQTPLTTLKLAELVAAIFPPGVINVVTGRGDTVGAPLIAQPDVRMISITGDVSTGQKILEAASRTVKRTHLELGGKAPVIVFDDADLEAVVEGIKIGGFFNAGQDCTAATRVIAGPKIFDKLLGDLVPAVESLRVGDPKADDTEMGPLVSEEQAERVTGFVDRARKDGAKILTGGARIKKAGSWYSPTVVV